MRALGRLLRPKSIAVIGGGAWCEAVVRRCLDAAFEGPVWPLHPTRESMIDLPVFKTVESLPAAPDASFIGVNRHKTINLVKALHDRGGGGAVCFASGFKEAADGGQLQDALLSAAGSMPLLGPNCYGFINALDRAALWPDVHGLKPAASGVAIIGQSSNVLLNLTMQRRGLPIAYLIAAGNQAKLGMADIGLELLDDDRVTALGLHVEGFGDIRAFEKLAAKARRMSKAVVVLKAGRSAAAREATLSHTASLAGSDAGAKALMARLGMLSANSLTQWLSLLAITHLHGRQRFERIVSLSCSGGEASLMADTAEGLPLSFPPLSTDQKPTLKGYLGDSVALANPFDYHTDIWRNAEALQGVYATAAKEPADITCLLLDYPRDDRCAYGEWDIAKNALIKAKEQTKRPFALIASLPENMPEEVAEGAMGSGVLPLFGLDDALSSLALTQQGAAAVAPPLLLGRPTGPPITLSEADAKAELKAFGLELPVSIRAMSVQDALLATATTGFPVVLKGEGAAHKSEAGLVRLGLMTEDELLQAARTMPTDCFLVESMVTNAIAELLIGIVHDPAHGFVLTLGAGGTLTELIDDSQSLLLPSSLDDVEQALASLKIAPLLKGYRGRQPANMAALLDAISSLQAYVAANADSVFEVEINPLLITPDKAIAVDALIVRTP